MGGKSSSKSSSTTTTDVQNLNQQGNQGISIAGSRAPVNLNVESLDDDVVQGAANITLRALDVIEGTTKASLATAVSAALSSNKDSLDFATTQSQPDKGFITANIKTLAIATVVGASVYFLRKKK